MANQESITVTDQRAFGPDEIGFYKALMAEIAARKEIATRSDGVAVEQVSTPPLSNDAVRMYGSE